MKGGKVRDVFGISIYRPEWIVSFQIMIRRTVFSIKRVQVTRKLDDVDSMHLLSARWLLLTAITHIEADFSTEDGLDLWGNPLHTLEVWQDCFKDIQSKDEFVEHIRSIIDALDLFMESVDLEPIQRERGLLLQGDKIFSFFEIINGWVKEAVPDNVPSFEYL